MGPWSNAGVFVRVWEYEVPGDRLAAFTTAYAADGPWGELFGRAAGFLGTELYRDAARAAPGGPLAPKPAHFPARANAVIWLFMEGAPSAVDLFDPKPALDKHDGQRVKIDVFNGNPGPLMKSPFAFKRYGRSGACA